MRDYFEEAPKTIGSFSVLNPSNLSQSVINFNESYTKGRNEWIKAHDNKLFHNFSNLGIKACKIYTHENIFTKLKNFMR